MFRVFEKERKGENYTPVTGGIETCGSLVVDPSDVWFRVGLLFPLGPLLPLPRTHHFAVTAPVPPPSLHTTRSRHDGTPTPRQSTHGRHSEGTLRRTPTSHSGLPEPV